MCGSTTKGCVHLLAFSRNTQWICKSNLVGAILGKKSIRLSRMRHCCQEWQCQAYKSFLPEKDHHCRTATLTLALGHQEVWEHTQTTHKGGDNSQNTVRRCAGLCLKGKVIRAQRTELGKASQRVWHLTQVLKNQQVFSKDKWRKEFHMEGASLGTKSRAGSANHERLWIWHRFCTATRISQARRQLSSRPSNASSPHQEPVSSFHPSSLLNSFHSTTSLPPNFCAE